MDVNRSPVDVSGAYFNLAVPPVFQVCQERACQDQLSSHIPLMTFFHDRKIGSQAPSNIAWSFKNEHFKNHSFSKLSGVCMLGDVRLSAFSLQHTRRKRTKSFF